MKRILFVCTGNTCRSPMAESLMRHMAEQAGLVVEVKSAGLAAAEGLSMSAHAQDVLQEKGIACEVFSKPFTKELADWADWILTMTEGHKSHILVQYPQFAEKVHVLKQFANGGEDAQSYDISDPFGGSLEEYKRCAEEIEDALAEVVNKLKE